MKPYRTITLLMLLVLCCAVPSFAVSTSYEFLDGGLTGNFVADGQINSTGLAFSAWNIVAPQGTLWASTDPNTSMFDNMNWGPILSLALGTQQHPGGPPFLELVINNLGELSLDATQGSYSFRLRIDDSNPITGSGQWQATQAIQPTVNSVPVPGTFWFMALGVGLLVIVVSMAEHRLQRLKVKR